MSDLIDDIMEDVKQEKLACMLLKGAKYIASIVILGLVVALLFTWWDTHKKNQIYNEAAQYLQVQHLIQRVQNKDELVYILKQLENISQGKTIYATLASLDLASVYNITNDINRTIYHYKAIANNSTVDSSLRSFAAIMEIACNLRAQKITLEEAIQYLQQHKELYKSFQHARELLQISVLLELGKKEEARAVIETIRTSIENDELVYALAELLLVLTV